MTCWGVVDSGLRRNDGGGGCLGCSFVGLLWGPVIGGLRGNASLPVPFALLVRLARFGRWRVRDATRREVPLRPLDLSRVDLLLSGTGVTPDGRACSPLRRMASGRARPSLGAFVARQADSGPHKTGMPRLCLAAVRRRHHCGWTPATERWFYAVCLEQVGAESRFRSASGRVRWGLRPYATA